MNSPGALMSQQRHARLVNYAGRGAEQMASLL